MSEAAPLWEIIGSIYEIHHLEKSVSPAWLATEGMQRIGFHRSLHELGWIGCHLQLRQIAREYCRERFDPAKAKPIEEQPELFPETLQERYPRQPRGHEEPEYVLLKYLSDADVDYNVARMRRAAIALAKHADALEAWKINRRGAA